MDLPIHFLLIAPESGHERLRRLIRKMPFTQRFHLCSRLEEAPGLLASSSVAVISNWRSELERRSCMQCLAAGVPVLGADTGIIRQMIQTEVNGELLSGNDPERLAHSIFELYENRDRRAMLSAGARRSARQWPSMHQQLLQMRSAFEQILTDGSAV
jgi:glycosyltransferase involved in cell wall biosynthesis